MPVKHKLLPSNPDSETLQRLSALLISPVAPASMAINRYNALCAALPDYVPTEEQVACDLAVENWECLNQRCAALERQLAERDALLHEMNGYLSRHGDGEAIHTGSKFHMAIDALLSASAEPASPWIAVTERLPDEHKADYLCLFEDGSQQVSEWLHDDTEGWCFWYGNPTHWMTLPDAPAKGGDGEAV